MYLNIVQALDDHILIQNFTEFIAAFKIRKCHLIQAGDTFSAILSQFRWDLFNNFLSAEILYGDDTTS